MDINLNYCNCGNKKSYSQEYDTYYCEVCNKWLEEKCKNPTCEYCISRPPTPNETL